MSPQQNEVRVNPVCSSNDPTWKKLNRNNRKLDEIRLRAASDQKWDSRPPASEVTVIHPSGRVSKGEEDDEEDDKRFSDGSVQGFCSQSQPSLDKLLFVIGGLCVVYGIVAK